MSLNVAAAVGAKLRYEYAQPVEVDSNTKGPAPWDKANLTGMTALPFALNLLEPSVLIGCCTAA